MYDDLVKTLRLRATLWEKMYDEDTVLKQAADAIEELEKDLERSKNYETFWNKEAEEALRRFQVAVANKPRWISGRGGEDMIIYTCPKCGENLVNYVIATYPPINVMECRCCGWKHEDKPKSAKYVPFPAEEGE